MVDMIYLYASHPPKYLHELLPTYPRLYILWHCDYCEFFSTRRH